MAYIGIERTDLIRQYPLLEEWFVNPQNTTAQLQGDNRSMSAQEKLILVGGEEQVKSNLRAVARDWQDSYIILLACRQEPMVSLEIINFGKRVEKDLGFGIYGNILRLMKEDELAKTQGFTYVVRLRSNPNRFMFWEDLPGYKTTEHGLRMAARSLSPKEQRGFQGGLVPSPV